MRQGLAGGMAGLLTAAAVLAAAAGGCQKQTGGGVVDSSSTVTRPPAGGPMNAQALYEINKYQAALAAAEQEYATSSGTAQTRAALIAGLSAHALGKDAEAQRWLMPLASNPNPDIAGRANSTLGMIASKSGQNAQAAEMLCRGAAQLSGDNAARAWLRAGHAYTEMRDYVNAKRCYDAALGAAATPPVKAAIEPYAAPGPFALQLGVFSAKANADRKANEVRAVLARLGYGTPRVIRSSAGGRFTVIAGNFANRQAAVLGSEKLPKGTGAIVVAGE